jgi:hypothetical protein
MRPPKEKETSKWLTFAGKDLSISKMLLKMGKQYTGFSLFHAQQAA